MSTLAESGADCIDQRPPPPLADFINRVFFAGQIHSTQLRTGVSPGSISAIHAPTVIAQFLSEDSRWKRFASSSPQNSGQSACLPVSPNWSAETPFTSENPVSDMLFYGRCSQSQR